MTEIHALAGHKRNSTLAAWSSFLRHLVQFGGVSQGRESPWVVVVCCLKKSDMFPFFSHRHPTTSKEGVILVYFSAGVCMSRARARICWRWCCCCFFLAAADNSPFEITMCVNMIYPKSTCERPQENDSPTSSSLWACNQLTLVSSKHQ